MVKLTNAVAPLIHEVEVMDEQGRKKIGHIPGERPLTIYLDKKELVTLMTMGGAPEALVLGYLRNQRLVSSVDAIESIQNLKKDVENVKQSVIVPKELFDDLLEKTTGKNPSYLTNDKGKVVFKKPENVNVLKERLALKYSVDVKTILTYDELLNTPIGSTKQYNVIIMPKGDGDRAAQRADVKMSFLCFH